MPPTFVAFCLLDLLALIVGVGVSFLLLPTGTYKTTTSTQYCMEVATLTFFNVTYGMVTDKKPAADTSLTAAAISFLSKVT